MLFSGSGSKHGLTDCAPFYLETDRGPHSPLSTSIQKRLSELLKVLGNEFRGCITLSTMLLCNVISAVKNIQELLVHSTWVSFTVWLVCSIENLQNLWYTSHSAWSEWMVFPGTDKSATSVFLYLHRLSAGAFGSILFAPPAWAQISWFDYIVFHISIV